MSSKIKFDLVGILLRKKPRLQTLQLHRRELEHRLLLEARPDLGAKGGPQEGLAEE